MKTSTDSVPSSRGGRLALGLGLACAFLGPVLYVAQLRAGFLATPWYAPALATLGMVLVLLALWRRPGAWRVLALVLVALVAGFQWWFLLGYTRLPDYAGPVAAGEPFPEFRAARADGSPFTRADLEGDKATALVFFRGRW